MQKAIDSKSVAKASNGFRLKFGSRRKKHDMRCLIIGYLTRERFFSPSHLVLFFFCLTVFLIIVFLPNSLLSHLNKNRSLSVDQFNYYTHYTALKSTASAFILLPLLPKCGYFTSIYPTHVFWSGGHSQSLQLLLPKSWLNILPRNHPPQINPYFFTLVTQE